MVPADRKQLGFGSLCFGFRENNNRKAYVYNEMKISFPPNERLSEMDGASQLVSVVDFHFKHMMLAAADQSTGDEEAEQEDEKLKSFFFNLFIYSSPANPVDTSSSSGTNSRSCSSTEVTFQLTILRGSHS